MKKPCCTAASLFIGIVLMVPPTAKSQVPPVVPVTVTITSPNASDHFNSGDSVIVAGGTNPSALFVEVPDNAVGTVRNVPGPIRPGNH